MEAQLFHIFRNTPLGRETFLQSIYFCKQTGTSPVVYIPRHTKFLMYFENDVVQVDLDESYIFAPETAQTHVGELLEKNALEGSFFVPKNFTASTLPDVPVNFDFMCCPRTISDLSSKIGLGYIGPRVRRIVNAAPFPVLISSPVYKPWNSITVLFGGSANAVNALNLGIRIARNSGLPLDMFTQANRAPEMYKKIAEDAGVEPEIEKYVREWRIIETGTLEENLYEIPHDALVVMGAFGHGLIRDFMFGNTMERVQSVISNNMLIVGPKYTANI